MTDSSDACIADAGVNLQKEIEQSAVRLLSYREHTVKQLREKLLAKDFDLNEINEVLDDLLKRNLISHDRFAEQYTSYRSKKGFGPLRIGKEMREKGVPDALIEQRLNDGSIAWYELMEQILFKKFGASPVLNFSERAKRARFLEYKGFESTEIRQCLFSED